MIETEKDLIALENLSKSRDLFFKEINKVVIGQKDILDQLLIALLSNGNSLLVGVPGLAKTLIIKTLSEVLDMSFKRIQFTPDLMPSDITGTELIDLDQETGNRSFRFFKGPVFANIVLADEINRTPPKTQSALLEAMQEKKVTVAGKNHNLQKPFFVLATQNPIEQEGTYPLPEAQLDRFMFLIRLDYPNREDELSIARKTTLGDPPALAKVLTAKKLREYQQLTEKIPVPEHVFERAVDLVRRTRPASTDAPKWVKDSVQWGAGPRAIQFLIRGAKARAVIQGNFITTSDDLDAVAEATLDHRIITNFHARSEGIASTDVVRKLIEEANKE